MSSIIQPTHDQALASPGLSRGLTCLLATGTGLGAASLYYNQPLLGLLAQAWGLPGSALGWVPTLTQLGYALGIALLAPLGDRFDRRQVILVKTAALTAALLVAGAAPGLAALLAASVVLGLTASVAQDLVPAAAELAPPAQRGQVVGQVMTGLLLGILLSRVVSGLVAQQLGWRSVFGLAAAAVALLGVALWRGLPHFAPSTQLPYGALLRSVGTLWLRHAGLRRAALAQGLLSLGFSAFWSTLAVMLHGEPLHLGSAAAGAFGLAGAVGALAAPRAGRLADRHGPNWVTRWGAGLAAASFGLMALGAPGALGGSWPASAQLALLAIGAVGFDLGVQAALIAHQTLVYSLDPAARSRLNAVLLVGMFIGMASGSALGSLALAHGGWLAVLGLATLASLGALVVRCWPARAMG